MKQWAIEALNLATVFGVRILKPLLALGILIVSAWPGIVSCQSRADSGKAVSSVTSAEQLVVHEVGDGLKVIERGDTLIWIRLRPDRSRRDTAIYVFKADSATRLRPAPIEAVSKVAADRMKAIRDQLRKIDAMDADLGKILR